MVLKHTSGYLPFSSTEVLLYSFSSPVYRNYRFLITLILSINLQQHLLDDHSTFISLLVCFKSQALLI